jgi:phytoene dehydrogenase-like protein
MKQYDVIIIGSGLGGLTAGAKIAKDGKKVLLIEQHCLPGGCATTFKRQGYTWDVGLHAMDGLDDEDPKRKIFNELGVFDKVKFITTPEFYRLKNQRLDITIPHSSQNVAKLLIERFPEERQGIEKFFKTIHTIRKESNKIPTSRWKLILLLPFFPFIFPKIFFNTFTTLGAFLDQEISNDDLKIILTGNILFYHDDPYTMSLIFFGIAQSGYFNGGSHYIQGSSQNLSNHLANTIKKNNGKILLNNLVTDIITKGNRAIGIKYIGSHDKKKILFSAYADKIIANTAVPNITSMLSGNNKLLFEKKNSKKTRSCSLISVYIGFKKEIKELNKHYCTFFLGENIHKLRDIKKNCKEDFSERSFFFTDYSQIDSNITPDGKTVVTIGTADYLDDWEGLTEKEYKMKKENVAQALFKRIEDFFPGITEEIEYYEVGTPKTIQRYTLNPDGAVYGFAQTPLQAGIFRLFNRSPIKNLYFASAWAYPGGGFTGAILSGWFCAKNIKFNR